MGKCFFEDGCNEPEEQRLGVGSRHSTQHGSASFQKVSPMGCFLKTHKEDKPLREQELHFSESGLCFRSELSWFSNFAFPSDQLTAPPSPQVFLL